MDILVNNRFVITNDNPPVWVRNTNMVLEAEAPKTWEDDRREEHNAISKSRRY